MIQIIFHHMTFSNLLNNIIKHMKLFINLILVTLLHLIASQYNHQSSTYVNSSWMGLLDNGIPIRKLSIIGSHSSMSTGVWGDAFQTQSNSLTGQMMMGMRALDIRCRHLNNAFPIHDRLVYLNTDLGSVLQTVINFLTAYPTQTILMHIVEEYNAAGNSQSFEATFISYKNTYSSFIWTPTSQNPVLGNVRGKIVIIQDFAGAQVHGLLYSTFTVLPHKWFNTNWDLYDKWTAVKGFLTSANAAGVSQLSFWTGHGGSFPYFVASGKSSPGNGAPRLVTGLTTPGFKSSYPDFPRVACFIGICSIVFEGINILGFNYISSQNLNYLGIIFTDFVGDNLLQKAIGMNTGKFTPCPVPLPTQGCTYCSSTGQCLGCNDTIHYIYDTASSTCFADKGYFLSVLSPTANIPVLCSVPMIGCLECTSGTTCTVCDIFANYALNVTVCSAAPGFYLDSASIPVPCYLTGCFQCITATTCAVCSTANNYIMDIPNPTCICDSINLFIQHPTAPACICKPGYFLSSTGTCNLIPVCPDLGSGCLNCTLGTPNVCAVCDAANNFIASTTFPGLCECIVTLYFDGTACVNCNTTLSPACTDCVSSTLCLACSGNFTLFQGDCICKPQYYLATAGQCLSCPIGCLQCNNASVCLICDTNNNFTLISSVCQCNSGLFLQNTACVPCGAMPGCITCNTLGCTGCDAIFGFTLNPTTSICECNFGFFVNSMIVCEACTQLGCLNCLSNTNCIQCDTTLFVLVNGTCEDICGDGIVYTVACDDGNLVNGDGCSSTCTVETDYTCVGGSTTSASLCSFSGTINIQITSFVKDISANTVYLTATISPVISSLAGLDFNAVFVPNFPISASTTVFDSTTGIISMTFDYNQSLNDQSLSVSFVPPATPTYFYMKTSSALLPQVTSNNLALKYYGQSQYELAPIVELIIEILSLLVIGSFAIGFLLSSKLLALQMIFIFQVTYCGLIMIKKLQVYMYPLRNLWIVNGYNSLFSDSPTDVLPGRISQINYKGQFLANFNIDLIIVLIPILVGAVILVVCKIKQNKSWRLRAYRILKEWELCALLLVQMHLDISILISFRYGMNQIAGLAAGAIIQILIIIYLFLYIKKRNNFGQYISLFSQRKISQIFYIIVSIFRTFLALNMVIFGQQILGVYIAVSLAFVYVILILIFKPYKTNFRPIVNSILILLILSIFCLSRINQNSTEVTFLTSYIPFILIGILCIALLFNIIFMILYKISKCKKQPLDSNALAKTLNQNENEQKQMDKIYIQNLKQQLKDASNFRKNNQSFIQLANYSHLKKIDILGSIKKQKRIDQSQHIEIHQSSLEQPISEARERLNSESIDEMVHQE